MKRKTVKRVGVGLNQYELDLFTEATKVYTKRGEADGFDRSYILRWSIIAFCSAVIRRGEIDPPMTAELRHETEQETLDRIHKIIPHADEKVNFDKSGNIIKIAFAESFADSWKGRQ